MLDSSRVLPLREHKAVRSRPTSFTGSLAIQLALCILFVIGWFHNGFSLYDVGTRSITLLQIAAALFLFYWSRRSFPFLVFPILSAVISLGVGVFLVTGDKPLTHFTQQMLGISLAAGVAGLAWPRLYPHFRLSLAILAVPILVYGIYQLYAREFNLPYAWLPMTNLQEYEPSGFQRNYMDRFNIRGSSVFVEPSYYGLFANWLIVCGLSSSRAKLRWILMCEGMLGIGLSFSLGALIGFLLMLLTYAIKARQYKYIILVCIGSLTVGLGVYQVDPGPMEKFIKRVGDAALLSSAADSERISRVPSNLTVIRDAPIVGHGLASLNEVEPNGTVIGYLFLMIERGATGTILYLVPFFYALGLTFRKYRFTDDLSGAKLYFSVLNVYSMANFAAIYYYPFWFVLGLTLSSSEVRRRNAAPDDISLRSFSTLPFQNDVLKARCH